MLTKRLSPDSSFTSSKRPKCNPGVFICPLNCGRSFKKMKNVYSHLMGPSGHNGANLLHEEERFKQNGWVPEDYHHYPFQCSVPGCNYQSGERRHLRLHYEKKHEEINVRVLDGRLPYRGELVLRGNELVCLDNGNGFCVYY